MSENGSVTKSASETREIVALKIETIDIASIIIGERMRKDLGELLGLAESIHPYFPDDLRLSAWRLRRIPGKPSVSASFLPN